MKRRLHTAKDQIPFKSYKVSLTKLDLSHNHLHNISMGFFDHFNNLKSLNLTHNSIISVYGFTVLNVEYLGLAYNKIKDFDEKTLKSFPHLKTIALDENAWNCKILTGVVQELRSRLIVIERGHELNESSKDHSSEFGVSRLPKPVSVTLTEMPVDRSFQIADAIVMDRHLCKVDNLIHLLLFGECQETLREIAGDHQVSLVPVHMGVRKKGETGEATQRKPEISTYKTQMKLLGSRDHGPRDPQGLHINTIMGFWKKTGIRRWN
ncbi:unnamed protein product [Brassicogethes aeneus]|uniref:Uncharacterized protein n=1 Tax=Brassicogethes aeneus TaxID=1431903 RepID=A0A9P0BFS5_BRAAE|nr:unnamed protein product [Brassicogethes aeneus]